MVSKRAKSFFIASAALLLAGCKSLPTAVPVLAPQSDLTALVGEWSGEYTSPETGRSGSISFMLQAGKDTAIGNVVMVPKAQNQPVTAGALVERPTVMSSGTQKPGELLTIRFVRLEGSQILGTLDPYRDPDCGCRLATTFRGEFKNATTIEGTFNTVGSGMEHLPSSGRWKVTRLAP